MVDLLLRRREIIAAQHISIPEWDYMWDYTQGVPTVGGWTLSKSGTTSTSMVSDGCKMTANNSSNINYNMDSASTSKGVYEVQFYIPTNGKKSVGQGNFRFGNSSTCVFVVFYVTSGGVREIRKWNKSGMASGTKIGSFSFDTVYTLRITLDGTADIELNGTALATGTAADAYYKGSPRFGIQNAGGSSIVFQSAKLRIGRT